MTTEPLPWRVKIRAFSRKHPYRMFLAILSLLAVAWFLYSGALLQAFIATGACMQILTLGLVPPQQYEQEFVADIFSQLKLEQDMLHVKQRQLKVSAVKKIVLDQLDEEQALIDFPFNIYRAVAMRFPAAQLPAVRAWLKQHLPAAEIIR